MSTDIVMAEMVKGCCGDAKWRGHFCPYHTGYEDGYDWAADEIERLRAELVALQKAVIFNEAERGVNVLETMRELRRMTGDSL